MGVPVRLDVIPAEQTCTLLNKVDSFVNEEKDKAKAMNLPQLALNVVEYEDKLKIEEDSYQEKLVLIKNNVQRMADAIYQYNKKQLPAHEITMINNSLCYAFLELYHKAATAHVYKKVLAVYEEAAKAPFLSMKDTLEKQKSFDPNNAWCALYTFSVDSFTQRVFKKNNYSIDDLTTLYGTPFQKELFDKLHTIIESAVTVGRAAAKLNANQKSTLSHLCVFIMALARKAAHDTALGYTDQAQEYIKTARSCLGYAKALYGHYKNNRALVYACYIKTPALGVAHLLKQAISQNADGLKSESIEQFIRALESSLQQCRELTHLVEGSLKELSALPTELLSRLALHSDQLSKDEIATLITTHPLTALFVYYKRF